MFSTWTVFGPSNNLLPIEMQNLAAAVNQIRSKQLDVLLSIHIFSQNCNLNCNFQKTNKECKECE